MVGGFVAPLLRDGGWRVTLAARDSPARRAIADRQGLWLRVLGTVTADRWVDGIDAVGLDDPGLPALVDRADLIVTAVGPSALPAIGRLLGPMLAPRVVTGRAVNVLAFENHRRSPEILLGAMAGVAPAVAGGIGRSLGVSGVAVWRVIATRTVTPDGVRFESNDEDECYASALALVPGVAPMDGSVPGLRLVRSFDDRMVEKLWLFNAGHCAAAWLGWRAGHESLDTAMADPLIAGRVRAVVGEAQRALSARMAAQPWGERLPDRPIDPILARYVDPGLVDPVARVGREPRRKLAPDDRLIGPAVAALAAGDRPTALAGVIAAGLAYAEPTDGQALDLRHEVDLVGPAEVLATVCALDPADELSRMVCDAYAGLTTGAEGR
jgi:mannitol-1-phosphate 5-dehydrogenase